MHVFGHGWVGKHRCLQGKTSAPTQDQSTAFVALLASLVQNTQRVEVVIAATESGNDDQNRFGGSAICVELGKGGTVFVDGPVQSHQTAILELEFFSHEVGLSECLDEQLRRKVAEKLQERSRGHEVRAVGNLAKFSLSKELVEGGNLFVVEEHGPLCHHVCIHVQQDVNREKSFDEKVQR